MTARQPAAKQANPPASAHPTPGGSALQPKPTDFANGSQEANASSACGLSSGLQEILLVDDSEPFRERLARAFRDRGYTVRTAQDYDDAMRAAAESAPDFAVIDLRMPGRSGLELLRDLKELHPKVKVLVLTGFGSIATAVDAVRLGAMNYLPKPADADDILAAFQRGQANISEATVDQSSAPSLARTEWEHIHRILADCDGNVSEAARRLGIHRRSLQRKLRKRAPE